MTAEKARDLLNARGVTKELADVRDYPCSDGCGEGPRFIVSIQGHTPVCYNLPELEETLACSTVRGRRLLKWLAGR